MVLILTRRGKEVSEGAAGQALAERGVGAVGPLQDVVQVQLSTVAEEEYGNL